MPVLSAGEAVEATDAFLWSLYGDELYDKWLATKIDMNFTTERDFVSWLLQLAHSYMYPPATTATVHPATYNTHTNTGFSRKRKNYIATTSQVDRVNNTVAVEEKQARFVSPHLKVESGVGGGAASLASSCEVRGEMREGDGDLLVEKSEGGGHLTSDEIILDSEGDDSAARDAELDGGAARDVKGYRIGETLDMNDDHTEIVSLFNISQVESDQPEQRLLTCAYCTYETRVKARLTSHVSAVHHKLKDVPCPHCSYMCAERRTLNNHLIYKHGYSSKYKCDVCGKSFHSDSRLVVHKQRCKPMLANY